MVWDLPKLTYQLLNSFLLENGYTALNPNIIFSGFIAVGSSRPNSKEQGKSAWEVLDSK